MKDKLLDEQVLKLFKNCKNYDNFMHLIPQELQDYIKQRYDDSESIKETIWRIKEGLEERPVCKICGDHVKFAGSHKRIFYSYCCKECQDIGTVRTRLKRYAELEKTGNMPSFLANGRTERERLKRICKITDDESVISYIKNRSNGKRSIMWKTLPNNVKEYLMSRYPDSRSLGEAYYRMINHIDTVPVCPICGKKIMWKNFIHGYNGIYCSLQCSAMHKHIEFVETTKLDLTRISIDGDYKYYDDLTDETVLQYIDITYLNDKVSWAKLHPIIGRYLDERYSDSTCRKESAYRMRHHLERRPVCEVCGDPVKFKQGRFIKNCGKLSCYATGSAPKTEKIFKEFLMVAFPDALYQYKDPERYPFNCDFYVPSTDTFIELNYFSSHGYHWFDPASEKDQKILEGLRLQNELGSIKIWTQTDPLKHATAEKNNLNYKVFWKVSEGYEWVCQFLSKDQLRALFIKGVVHREIVKRFPYWVRDIWFEVQKEGLLPEKFLYE